MSRDTVERIKAEARRELAGVDEELLNKFYDYLGTVFQLWKLERGDRNPQTCGGLLTPASPIPFKKALPWQCANLLHPCPAALAVKLLHENYAPFMTIVGKTSLRKVLALAIVRSDDASTDALLDAIEVMREHIHLDTYMIAGFSAGLKDAAVIAAKKAVDALHDKPGASRDLKKQIRLIWASGKFLTRDYCADQEWESIGFGSRKTARNALLNTPDPKPWPAKEAA